MPVNPIHFFLELFTFLCFLICFAHAIYFRASTGGWFFFSASLLGFFRENFVILRDYLYGFAPLALMAGKTPLISAIIWGYSIYVAFCWSERLTGEVLASKNSWRFDWLACLFMVILAIFYEPLLKLIGMARWQAGTRTMLDVPLIALVGYPSMTVLFVIVWRRVMDRFETVFARFVAFLILIPAVSVMHVIALQSLKNLLHW